MSYPPLTRSRRSRRRRRSAILLLVAVAVALVALAVRYRTEQRDVTDYMALAKEVADGEAEAAANLGGLLSSLGSAERADLFDRLGDLGGATSELHRSLDDVTVPRPLAEVHGFLAVAASAWSDAIHGLDDAMLRILDESDDPAGEAMLRASFDLIRVGDRAYAYFLSALDGLDPDLVTRQYPDVSFVATGGEGLYSAPFIAERLRLLRGLGERHDIAVTATVTPEPVGEEGGLPVVPFSPDFSVEAVVSNTGNLPETDISVKVRVVTQGSGSTAEYDEVVPALAPGEATTVSFTGIDVPGGGIYELVVSGEIAEDADPANSVFRFIFLRNADS